MSGAEEALQHSNVVGFTVCPPKGSHLDQEAITEALTRVAERGLTLALYQLPQVTGNEMSPETVRELAIRHSGTVVQAGEPISVAAEYDIIVCGGNAAFSIMPCWHHLGDHHSGMLTQ